MIKLLPILKEIRIDPYPIKYFSASSDSVNFAFNGGQAYIGILLDNYIKAYGSRSLRDFLDKNKINYKSLPEEKFQWLHIPLKYCKKITHQEWLDLDVYF